MKKILAILLALSMVFAFAACGSKDNEENTTDTTAEEITEAEDTTEATSAEDTTEATEVASAADDSTAASEDATKEVASESKSEEAESETEKTNIPQTTEEIVAYYNKARKATNPVPKGKQTMALKGDITGEGAIGTFSGILTSAANKALSKNSKETDWIPAADHADIKVSDVKSATAKDDGKGNIIISMTFKDQTDGSDGDNNNGGPVARGVGTLGSIDGALAELGASITEGRDTVSLTYTDAYIKNVKINQKTGKITGGTWHYLVKVHIVDAKAKLGITAHLENVKAQIDYTVAI